MAAAATRRRGRRAPWLAVVAALGAAVAAAMPAPTRRVAGEENGVDDTEAYYKDLLPGWGDAVFGYPKEEIGDRVAEWSPESKMNPEEMGWYKEGDILLPRSRNGLAAKSARWPDGIVYYSISPDFSQRDQERIHEAFRHYHEFTCVRWVQRTTEKDYVYIQRNETGCFSALGRVGGKQKLNLESPECTYTVGTPIHEMMHTLGFRHEHTRWERDNYVTINWENIEIGREDNFKKATKESTKDFGVPYDYNSVMHYSPYAFSKNGRPTIVPSDRNAKIGQRNGLSTGDLKKINTMYGCKNDQLPHRNSSVAAIIDDISAFFG